MGTIASAKGFPATSPEPVRLTVEVLVAKPKTTKLYHPKPDADNYAKGLMDAITDTERFWEDDRQVVDLHISKAWAPVGTEDGYRITLEFLS